MKTVWVAEFENECADLNAVFSTREKAERYILENAKRMYFQQEKRQRDIFLKMLKECQKYGKTLANFVDKTNSLVMSSILVELFIGRLP